MSDGDDLWVAPDLSAFTLLSSTSPAGLYVLAGSRPQHVWHLGPGYNSTILLDGAYAPIFPRDFGSGAYCLGEAKLVIDPGSIRGSRQPARGGSLLMDFDRIKLMVQRQGGTDAPFGVTVARPDVAHEVPFSAEITRWQLLAKGHDDELRPFYTHDEMLA